jgi:hypothetical protein
MPSFKQTQPTENLGLKPVAVLVATPEELAERYGIKFELARDDLGPYTWATGEVDGEPFAFERHLHSSEEGTTLYGRESADKLVEDLDLPDKWRPESSAPAPRKER